MSGAGRSFSTWKRECIAGALLSPTRFASAQRRLSAEVDAPSAVPAVDACGVYDQADRWHAGYERTRTARQALMVLGAIVRYAQRRELSRPTRSTSSSATPVRYSGTTTCTHARRSTPSSAARPTTRTPPSLLRFVPRQHLDDQPASSRYRHSRRRRAFLICSRTARPRRSPRASCRCRRGREPRTRSRRGPRG